MSGLHALTSARWYQRLIGAEQTTGFAGGHDYHDAYIDKVRVPNDYGSTDGQLPDYIKQKKWARFFPEF